MFKPSETPSYNSPPISFIATVSSIIVSSMRIEISSFERLENTVFIHSAWGLPVTLLTSDAETCLNFISFLLTTLFQAKAHASQVSQSVPSKSKINESKSFITTQKLNG